MTKEPTRADAEMKPCPFCGDKDDFNPSLSPVSKYAEPGDLDKGTVANLDAGTVPAGFVVECDKCASLGPHHATEAEAIAAWNSRPVTREAELVEAGADFKPGDVVRKIEGYPFGDGDAVVLAAYRCAEGTGPWRYVVEHREGWQHIFSGKQLALSLRTGDPS